MEQDWPARTCGCCAAQQVFDCSRGALLSPFFGDRVGTSIAYGYHGAGNLTSVNGVLYNTFSTIRNKDNFKRRERIRSPTNPRLRHSKPALNLLGGRLNLFAAPRIAMLALS